jgi:hypothetical protein
MVSMLWPIKLTSDVGRDQPVRSTTDMGGFLSVRFRET